jgi:hypothetical protein
MSSRRFEGASSPSKSSIYICARDDGDPVRISFTVVLSEAKTRSTTGIGSPVAIIVVYFLILFYVTVRYR